ncbi:hypothetical protein CCP3SC1_220035 [Gammaproteobacteria bacterium]
MEQKDHHLSRDLITKGDRSKLDDLSYYLVQVATYAVRNEKAPLQEEERRKAR